MRRIALALCLILMVTAITPCALGDEKFFPPKDYAYIPADRESVRESSGTGGTQPLLGNSLVKGSEMTYAQWWSQNNPKDKKRQRMQKMVDGWKQDAVSVWQLNKEDFPQGEIEFDETVVGRLLSVRARRGAENGDVPCAVFDLAAGRQLQLSDLFYDGFNYIDYINTFLTQKPDQCYHTYWNNNGPVEDMFKRPFPGLARDYPYFGVTYPSGVYEIDDPLPVMLQLLWTDANPYWQAPMMDDGVGDSEDYYFVGVPLTHWASPYGECLIDVTLTKETWQDFRFFAPHISIDQGRYPEAEKKINQVLDTMAASFREMYIPNAIDDSGFGDYQIKPYISCRGQTLHVSLEVPTPNYDVTVFDGSFDLHTGERLPDIGNRIDGNAKLIQLTVPFLAKQLGISQEEAALRISHGWERDTKYRLLQGEIDLALVTTGENGILDKWAGPDGEKQKDLEMENDQEDAYDVWGDFDYIPIAVDALVFVNRIENPVKALTVGQLQSIYSGMTASWEEVGGKAKPAEAVAPYMGTMARNMFDQYIVMYERGSYLPEGDLSQLSWLSYKGKEVVGALQWAERWGDEDSPGLRMLAVDGIRPTYQTIFDGTYPLSVTYYAVMKKGLPKNAPARQLVGWLLSDEGQQAMKDAGYVAVRELDE